MAVLIDSYRDARGIKLKFQNLLYAVRSDRDARTINDENAINGVNVDERGSFALARTGDSTD